MKKIVTIFFLLSFTTCLISNVCVGRETINKPEVTEQDKKVIKSLEKIVRTLYYLDDFYYKDLDLNECVDQILEGGISGCTDPYTHFLNKEEIKKEAVIYEKYSIFHTSINNYIGYVKVDLFAKDTARDFEVVVTSLAKTGMKVLIIDLRDNPGGLVSSSIDILSFFASNSNPLIYVTNKDGPDTEIFPNSYKLGVFRKLKVVVLVNINTASSSEIMAGWLMSDFGAVVIGKRTYGKNLIQAPIGFPDKSCLVLTISEYFIGKKKINIGKVGIVPMIEINNAEEKKDGEDNQLFKAIEVAKEIVGSL
jgi:carboxyl-terminal processing protease